MPFPQIRSDQQKRKKTRLMQISHDLAIGGLQQVVVNICRTINRDLFDISVLCLRDLGEFVTDVEKLGIKVYLLPQKEGTDYFSFLKVAKILRQKKIEVIHTHNTQPFFDGTIGALMSGVKTIVHTDHARLFPDKRRYMFAEWAMSHFAYKVVGVSEATSYHLQKYEHIPSKKITTIPNGIDPDRYNITIDKKKKKAELGIKKRGPVIGLGARLVKEKGIVYLLRAMPLILEKFPDVSLVIAGDGILKEALKKEACSLGIDRDVFFIGLRNDIPEILKIFDLYVLPSISEGLPLGLLEAMAAYTPIVATKVGGNSTIIKDSYNGFLVKPKNSSRLAHQIITLLSDRALADKYIENSKKILMSKYSAEIMTKHYEKLYTAGLNL